MSSHDVIVVGGGVAGVGCVRRLAGRDDVRVKLGEVVEVDAAARTVTTAAQRLRSQILDHADVAQIDWDEDPAPPPTTAGPHRR